MFAVFDRAAGVGGRRHDRHRCRRGFFERRLVEAGSDHGLRRVRSQQRRFVQIGEADRATGDLAARHRQHDRRRRGGVVADLALEFFVGVAVTSRRRGNRDEGKDFAGLEGCEIGALIEFRSRDVARPRRSFEPVACAQRHHQRRHVIAGIAIGDVAADRAHVTHLRIGDQKRGFVQDRQRFCHLVRRQQLVLGGHGADHDVVAVAADALEPRNAVQIDQMLRCGQPKLHHRDQTMATGKGAGLFAQR